MVEVCINIPDELKEQAEQFNLDVSRLLAELIKREILKRKMVERFNSKEEKELIKWSVELGRRAKKGRFKELVSELSPEERERLLKAMAQEKREEYK